MVSRSTKCSGRRSGLGMLGKAAVLSVLMALGGSLAGTAMGQASNDEAATAQELNIYNSEYGGYVQGQLCLGATASAQTPSCAGAAWADVWYHVTALPEMQVTAQYSSESLANGTLSVYTGPSASQLTERGCAALSPSSSYVRVDYTTAAGETDVWLRISSQNASQVVNLSVAGYQPICEEGTTEDTPSGASWFTCDGTPVTGALLANATPSPGQPGALSVPDIWMPANGRSITVEYDDGNTTGPGFVVVYSGWCGSLWPVGFTTQRDADGKFRATGFLGRGEHGEGQVGMVRVGSSSTSANQSVKVLCYSLNDDMGTAQEIIPGTSGCQTVSGQLLLNATSPGYSSWGEDNWASCADPEARTVWYRVAVTPGQTVTAGYTAAAGTVSIWSGESQWYAMEQGCAAVTSSSTPASVSYTAATGESEVWIQISGQDNWATSSLGVCVSQ